jgi:hypothetical protein
MCAVINVVSVATLQLGRRGKKNFLLLFKERKKRDHLLVMKRSTNVERRLHIIRVFYDPERADEYNVT